jgi:carboxymethylenebutenolidase
MSQEVVKIAATDGSGEFSAFVVDSGRGAEQPGVVVIQEIFGVNDYIRSVARELAGQGYRVCAPDLFWRLEPEIELDPETDEDRKRARALTKAFDRAKGLEDCDSAAAWLGRQGSRKVGVVGFCMGGRLAYEMAAGSRVDACVGYYGTRIHEMLDLAEHLATPLLLHIAENDHLCDAEARRRIHDALGSKERIELHDYAGVGHAFARTSGKSYNAEAAALAHERTAEFLARHLSP